jgi:plasmid stabilization system protein ParE
MQLLWRKGIRWLFMSCTGTFRRVLLQRFPYALFYQFGDDRIVVVAVLHQAGDPQALLSL